MKLLLEEDWSGLLDLLLQRGKQPTWLWPRKLNSKSVSFITKLILKPLMYDFGKMNGFAKSNAVAHTQWAEKHCLPGTTNKCWNKHTLLLFLWLYLITHMVRIQGYVTVSGRGPWQKLDGASSHSGGIFNQSLIQDSLMLECRKIAIFEQHRPIRKLYSTSGSLN